MPCWWYHLAAKARALSLAGFTAISLPPVLNTASGATQQRWKDFDVLAYEHTGGSRLLVALNNDPRWKPTAPMHFARRQHNATVLPDGSMLVTGGTRGIVGNPQWLGFDNVRPGGPVHQAELWDPATGQWTPSC